MPKATGAKPATSPPSDVGGEAVPISDPPKPARVSSPKKPPAKPRPPTPTPDDQLESFSPDDEDYLSILYYGPEGTGKTSDLMMLSTLDQPGNLLVVRAEAGMKRRALINRGVVPERIRIWPPRGTLVTYEGLERLFIRIAGDLQDDPQSWVGVAFDSMTEIHDVLLEQAIQHAIDEQAEILAKAGAARAGNIEQRDPFESDSEDYMRIGRQIRSLLRKFAYLPCHFAMSALFRQDAPRKGKVTPPAGPEVSPKVQSYLLGLVDVVIRTAVTQTPAGPVWFGKTVPSTDERAKDRYDVLPPMLVNPTFDRVWRYISGDLTPDKDPQQKLLPGRGGGKPPANDSAPAKPEPDETEDKPTTAKPPARKPPARRRATASTTKADPVTASSGSDDKPPF